MQAKAGDRIVIKGHRVGEPDRDCQVIEVRGPDETLARLREALEAHVLSPKSQRWELATGSPAGVAASPSISRASPRPAVPAGANTTGMRASMKIGIDVT